MKCLYFESDGYCILAKRLERGSFQVDLLIADKVAIDLSTLRLLIDGISVQSVQRYKRYQHPQPARLAV
jgi:hypothetical protein